MEDQQINYEIGLIGLGVMGRNLLLNMADHGFSVVGYNRHPDKVETLRQEAKGLAVRGTDSIEELLSLLRKPRALVLLVTAGPAVDAVIDELLPHLEKNDLIIDAGNSYFKDSNRRAEKLAARGINFLGVGVSGGEEGARRGPSIMPGGPQDAYERVRPVFEAVAAKVNGDPCVEWLGHGSAGHFVKMVHNGIEYAVMQLIAETYDLMKRGLGLSGDEMHDAFGTWNSGELSSYLLEITSHIFAIIDERTGMPLIDKILGVAKQKGTGMWTSESGMELQVPTPTIDLAVAMRDMSVFTMQRQEAGRLLDRSIRPLTGDRQTLLDELRDALYAATIITYAQGMGLLAAASVKYDYHLDLESVARIWRGGCIIRASLLEEIRAAFGGKPDLANLLLDPSLTQKIMTRQESLRKVVGLACESGIPAPGLMVSLGYLDSYRSVWLPANLIQAQRDYFGAHTYERLDSEGAFHTEWEKK